MEFGREVYGVPGNVTVDVSLPQPDDQTGAKLVTSWEDVIEELPTEIRAEMFPVELHPGGAHIPLRKCAFARGEENICLVGNGRVHSRGRAWWKRRN